jgi:fructokinase
MTPKLVIAGIGEVLWDVYPDAARFGGAPANFACHASALGADATMVSAVGNDDLGNRAIDTLARAQVHHDTVATDAAHETGQVRVTLDLNGQPTYEFATDTAWDNLTWSPELESLATRCDAVCFGTLAQRSAKSRETIQRFLQSTSRTALLMFDVNLRQHFYDGEVIQQSLERASAVKLNEDELPIVAHLCGIEEAPLTKMLRELIERFDLRLGALTCGAAGAVIIAGTEESTHPALPTKVLDTVGAGDAFTATLVCDFLKGRKLVDMNRHANAVASYVCSQPGAVMDLPAELRDA